MDIDQIATSATRNKINKLGSVKHSEMSSLLSFSTDENGKGKDTSSAQLEKSKVVRDLEARLLNFKSIRDEFAKVTSAVDAILQAGTGSHAATESNVKEIEEVTKDAIDDDEGDEADNDDDDDDDDDDVEMKEGGADDTKDRMDTPKRKKTSTVVAASQPKKTRPKKETTRPTAAESTFVSTLYSSSDDDDEEEEISPKKKQKKSKSDDWVDDKFDEYYGAPKKNRPGQRARREYVYWLRLLSYKSAFINCIVIGNGRNYMERKPSMLKPWPRSKRLAKNANWLDN
jgi:hypothetical protein